MAGPGAQPALTFRGAGADDVPALHDFIETAYRGEESRRGWTTEADLLAGPRTSASELAGLVGGARSRLIVAEQRDALVGCCALERHAGAVAHLGMLSVLPRCQARGIGRSILSEAERFARTRWGVAHLRMQVIRQRDELIAWYERVGYRRTGETLPFVIEASTKPYRDDLEFVVLVKALAAAGTRSRYGANEPPSSTGKDDS